jgi:asparagine synthase (glutamine-hydrolysing)
MYLIRLALVHPSLALLSWNLKRSQKTYLGYRQLYSLVDNFFMLKSRCPDFVHVAEFGVGRGGSAAVLGWLIDHYGGTLTLYDVFGRIPSPSRADGERARKRYETIINEETEDYYGNISNLQALIEQELSSICSLDKIEFISGRYEEKLNKISEKHSFDLIHIDCDWYESVMAVLSYLQDNISPNAIIQVDDYSNWQGCTKAVNETKWLKPFKKWIVEGPLVIDTGSTS